MRALILAAGRGSRMKGLTDERPKCLVELAGRPLLDYQLAALRGAGMDPVGAVRGWQAQLLDGRGLVAFDNPRWAETNMVSSLACAAAWLRAGPCLVSYSDIVYSASAVAALAAAPGDVAITFDPAWLALWSRRFADPLADAETFRRDVAGHVIEIGRRAATLAEIEGQYMGLLKFTPAGWGAAERVRARLEPAARDRLDMTSLLRLLIESGSPVNSVPVSGPWGEVDSADDLAVYERMIIDGQLRL
jgi:L-glutamine-phosphate cytidylyltransferase